MKKIITLLFTMVALLIMSVITSSASGEHFEKASVIYLNTNYTENLSDEYDIKYYKFNMTSSGYININFKHKNLFDKNEYWNAIIYDGQTNEIVSFSFLGTNTDTTTYKIGLEKGTYFLRVTGGDYGYQSGGWIYSGNFSDATFSFKINCVYSEYWEKENNEAFEQATLIKNNTFYTASINDNKDLDYYRFDLTNSGYIFFDFQHAYIADSSEYWELILYDSQTNEISTFSFFGADTQNTTHKIGLESGTYYIRIAGGDYGHQSGGWIYSSKYNTMDYSFNLKYTKDNNWEKENNDSLNTATETSLYKKTYGSINDNKDLDYYKLLVKENINVKIAFVNNTKNQGKELFEFVLFDSGNKEIDRIDIEKSKTIYFYLPAGLYYIRITGGDYGYQSGGWIYSSSYTTTDYSFTISEHIYVPQVTALKSSSISTSSHAIKWGKVAGVTGYEVYRYDSSKKKYVKIKTTSSTKYKASKLKSGTTYKYKVRAYIKKNGSTHYGAFSSVLSAGTKPTKTTLSSVKSKKPAQLTAAWKTVSGVTGYEVTYSTSKKFTKKTTKTVTIKKSKTKKTTIKKLKKGKKYYVKVRAYKTVSGKKIYGAYSSVKSVKVK